MELKWWKRRSDWWVRTLCEWASHNEPLLAFRSDEEIEKVVRTARTEKSRLVSAISISITLVALYVTWRITADLFGYSPTLWQAAAVAMPAGLVANWIVRIICDLVMHREISERARGIDGQLSHE